MEEEKIICIFGDSITWGACDLEKGGWANRLILDLAEESDYNISAYNLGISGENTKELLKRFENEAKIRMPETIIFAIGINDSHKQEISLDEFKINVINLIDKANKIASKVFWVGLTFVDESIAEVKEKDYVNDRIKEYDSAIKKICKEKSAGYISVYDVLSKEDLEDGLHPNTMGHKKLYKAIKSFIKDKI